MDDVKILSREQIAHERFKILALGIVQGPRVRISAEDAIFGQDYFSVLAGLTFQYVALPDLLLAVGALCYELRSAPASSGKVLSESGLRIIWCSYMSALASNQGIIRYSLTFRTMQYYR